MPEFTIFLDHKDFGIEDQWGEEQTRTGARAIMARPR
jgi:hypothetical protein